MSLRFLADEDFRRRILRALRRRHPGMDLLRVQDVGLAGANDPTILEWAAREGRVLLTHDVSTMPDFAYERVGQGLPMPGVFVIRQALPLAQVIEEVILLAECSREGEWEGRVVHLPL
jgi:predicted nuclease of predicted toxin-antitoxin system